MKKLLILTTALVLIAAACNKQAAVQPIQNQMSQNQSSTDVTANWKTYTNSQFNFQTQIPSNWDIASTNQSGGITVMCFAQSGYSDVCGVEINVHKSDLVCDNCITAADLIVRRNNPKEVVTIGNERADLETASTDAGLASSGTVEQALVDHAGMTYRISSYAADTTENDLVFQKMISTFKFTKADNTFIKIDGYNSKHITVLLDGSILGTPSGHLATSQLKALNDTISKTDFNVLDSNKQLTCSSSIGTNVDFKIQVNGQLHSYSVCDSKLTTTEPFKSFEFTLRYFLQ